MTSPTTAPAAAQVDLIRAALAGVVDPEIHRPITDLGMVKDVRVEGGAAHVAIYLTVAGCPMKEKLTHDVTAAAAGVSGITSVTVELDVMDADQREQLRRTLRGNDSPEPVIPFAEPSSRTRVYAVASGKGGVGKSSVTVNLAVAMAQAGLSVGIVDADVYGFSVPRMMGVETPPTRVDDMILPPEAHGVRVISIGMFVPGNQPVVWRGPMLHRALQQFLADVFWGDLDVLLMDLPPGTGDIAISVGQLLPASELLVVTTPQLAAAEVAERAGAVAAQTRQRVAGVIENMSWLDLPDGSRMEVFGSGGGAAVAASLSRILGADVPLLGQVPIDVGVREGGDAGLPVVLATPDSAGAQELRRIAGSLSTRPVSLVGRRLDLSVSR